MKENHQNDLSGSRRMLILPVFIVVVAMVIVFLAFSWSIRSVQLLLPKVLSFSAPRRRDLPGRN